MHRQDIAMPDWSAGLWALNAPASPLTVAFYTLCQGKSQAHLSSIAVESPPLALAVDDFGLLVGTDG